VGERAFLHALGLGRSGEGNPGLFIKGEENRFFCLILNNMMMDKKRGEKGRDTTNG